jgi:rhodanese-related sulfurtransferase
MKKIILVIILLLTAFFLGKVVIAKTNNSVKSSKEITTVTPEQFSQRLNSGQYILLDIRTLDEYNTGHIKGAKQIDYYQTQQFSDYLDSLDKNAKYLIYCRTGHRSSAALKIMQEKSFTNVIDLSGGITAWTAQSLPIE